MSDSREFELLLEAARNGFESLFKEHNEKYYYCTLILSEGSTPFISAFSKESLLEAVKKNHNKYSQEELKWSYADSPYCGYGYEEYFQAVDKAFNERMDNVSDEEYDKEIEYWLSLMEKVMKTLDEEKVFGEGRSRSSMLINAEIMPPDESNAERAKRLNTKSTYQKWYKDNFDEAESTLSIEYLEKVSNMSPKEFVQELRKLSGEQANMLTFYIKLTKMSRVEIALALDKMTSSELEITRKYIDKLKKEKPIS